MFEIELIKQVEINVDHILMLVQKYRSQHGDGEDKEIRAEISRAVDASATVPNKKDLIEAFADSVLVDGAIDEEWQTFIAAKLEAIIEDEGLRADDTRAFNEIAFRDDALRTSVTAIANVLPPTSRFAPDGGHGDKKQRVVEKIGTFFERLFGLAASADE